MKNKYIAIFLCSLMVMSAGCGNTISQEEYDSLQAEKKTLETEMQALKDEKQQLSEDLSNIESELSELNDDYESYKEKMAPYEKLSVAEAKAKTAEAEKQAAEAEKAKKELSTTTTTNINLPFITMNQDGPKHLDVTLTRAKFDELTNDLVDRTMTPVRQALSDADLTANDIDKVLLVGGSTRIPAVQDAVKKFTGKDPFKGINPDECVAVGASIQGGKLSGEQGAGSVLLLDVTPLSLGIETLGGVATKLIDSRPPDLIDFLL